ncbi:MAG: M23 family metallopeptidase, partial [Proteobacteria bacterium]|nr:M23 family metallopeptidase [Pseudomonadota bacterium]
TYRLERGPDGRVRAFDLVVSKLHRVHAGRDASGTLIGTSTDTATRVETKAITGTIDETLYGAIKASGETAALVDFFVDVFAYDLDFFNDTHEGDTFKIVVEKEIDTTTGELLRYKRVLGAEYRGKAGTFQTYAFGNAYYDAKGDSSAKSLLKTPLKFSRVSSGFDRKRMHPVLHTTREHLGVDYAAPVGTPVWAAADGTITSRGMSGGAGNLVMIKHASGVETAYMHLSKFADNQKVGQQVAAKTVIGYVGQTGLATGPHLHFGVKVGGEFIDPSKMPPMHGPAITAKDLDAFHTELARLDALMTSH